jgi:3-hydroxybutyryl-CoA dehydrogenase
LPNKRTSGCHTIPETGWPEEELSCAATPERDAEVTETLGIAGAGTIAIGLAAVASTVTDTVIWARSQNSAQRAQAALETACSKLEELGADPARCKLSTEISELRACTFLVEAIVEDQASKAQTLADLDELCGYGDVNTIIATTTSSLSVVELAQASGRPELFAGLHVFNPVPRMELVELVFPPQASAQTRERTRRLCEDLGKTAVEVPDTAGFVVNRLLFPYLFDAVALMDQSGLSPQDVDTCMTLGAGVPMGPIALLDFIGLDVAEAIGESIGLNVPYLLEKLVAAGALGKKVGKGFYKYA